MPRRSVSEDMVSEENEPYAFYVGSSVELDIRSNGQRWGFYRGKNRAGDLVLRPYVRHTARFVNPDSPEVERVMLLEWCDSPLYISHQDVTDFGHKPQEELNREIEDRLKAYQSKVQNSKNVTNKLNQPSDQQS